MKSYQLPFGIVVEVKDGGGRVVESGLYAQFRSALPLETVLGDSDIDNGEFEGPRQAADVIESLILAHACAGLDVGSDAYCNGLKTAVDAIADNIFD